MTHYSDKPECVRVDIFEGQKFHTTIEMVWYVIGTWEHPMDIDHEFRVSLERRLKGDYRTMTAVCLRPYHPDARPVMRMVE